MPRSLLRDLFNRNKGKCSYCWRDTELPRLLPNTRHDLTATIDHKIPLSLGGPKRGDNCVLACNQCNNLKSNKTPAEWVVFMVNHPKWWKVNRRDLKRRRGIRMVSVPEAVQIATDRLAKNANGPLPVEQTLCILREGKDAWREKYGVPAVPIEYSDPKAQAAFEAAYHGRHHLLRP